MVIETCSSELSLLLHVSVSGSFSSSQNEKVPSWIGMPDSVPSKASVRPGGTEPFFANH